MSLPAFFTGTYMEGDAILNIMKKLFIVFGALAITINACTSKDSFQDAIIEIVTDDFEDLIEIQTGIDLDLNDNGK